jgi:Putative peptidoglycan binding domain
MQKILAYAAMAAMSLLAWSANGAEPAVKKPPAKKGGTRRTVSKKRPAGATKKPVPSASAARRASKKAPVKRATTWRNRQTAPTPERYREIQAALVAKGYLKSEDAVGPWNQSSVDALKNFQTEQNLDSTGKINALSLIALGLGPRREAAPPVAKPPFEKPPGEKPPGEQAPGQHW